MIPWRPRLPHWLLFREAEEIIAISRPIQEEYEKRSGRKIRVIPPRLPFEAARRSKSDLRKAYGYREEDQVIMTLGSIKKIKGSDLLLQAFFGLGPELIEKRRARLLVVGNGPMREALEVDVKQRRFDRWVRFLGNVPHDQVPEMYRLADIYVIPSLMEGAPLSLMEAMFNGLSIVGSDIESIRLFIQDGQNGLLFKKGEIRGLEEKLRALLSNQGLGEKLGRSARLTHDSALCFKDVVDAHLRLYEKIARTH